MAPKQPIKRKYIRKAKKPFVRLTPRPFIVARPIKAKTLISSNKYYAFIDLETMCAAHTNECGVHESRIRIKEFGICIVQREHFHACKHPSELMYDCIELKQTTEATDYMDVMLQVIRKYNPIFIAHNGFGFDYRILFQHANECALNLKEYSKKHRYADSLDMIKSSPLNPKINSKNGTLFQQFHVERYSTDVMLLSNQHEALPDAKMTMLWCFATKQHLDFNKHMSFTELEKLYKREWQKPANSTIPLNNLLIYI